MAFSCKPDINGTATIFNWTATGDRTSTDRNPSFTVNYAGADGYDFTLTACNDNKDSCTSLTQHVDVQLAVPLVGAPGCPATADLNKAITCTASGVSHTYPSTTWTWTASNGALDKSSTEGEGSTVTITFSRAGDQSVTVMACTPGFTVSTPTAPDLCTPAVAQTVTVNGIAPTIATAGCNPLSGPPPLVVLCSASVTDGKNDQTKETWSTSGSLGDSGSGDNFTTKYEKAGTYTITFTACNGTLCAATQTFSISVNAPQAPTIGPIICSPPFPTAGDQVTCSATVDPAPPTSKLTWAAQGGAVVSASGTSETVTFSDTGAHAVSLKACNGDACATQSTTVVVASKGATLNGSISVTEGDIGCGFSAMPATGGTITISITFPTGPAGGPGSATGHLSGGGGGSRTFHCNGGSGTLSWTASYTADFTGSVDPVSGAVNLNGTMHVTQSLKANGCKDSGGNTVPCDQPGYAPSTSYAIHVIGNYSGAGGSGSLVMDSNCSTAGSWNASK